ncbi:MAG: inositol monophosphatase family protein [bacterium]
MRINPDRLLACAVSTARQTAAHALSQTARRQDVAKTLAHDVKLKLDQECQIMATRLIRSSFPGHRILGEEDETSTTISLPDFSFATNSRILEAREEDILWIVDPLDGTVNFNHGIPLWCCSVAVAIKQEIVAGAVYAPVLDRCYAARAGRRATCNGRTISVSDRKHLSESIIATGLDRTLGKNVKPYALFNSIAARAQRARILGSAALDLCLLAEGAADGYLEGGIFIWDIAAGGLIVQQAGGQIEQLARFPGNRICFLASNGIIHSAMRAAVRPVLKTAIKHGARRKQ